MIATVLLVIGLILAILALAAAKYFHQLIVAAVILVALAGLLGASWAG